MAIGGDLGDGSAPRVSVVSKSWNAVIMAISAARSSAVARLIDGSDITAAAGYVRRGISTV